MARLWMEWELSTVTVVYNLPHWNCIKISSIVIKTRCKQIWFLYTKWSPKNRTATYVITLKVTNSILYPKKFIKDFKTIMYKHSLNQIQQITVNNHGYCYDGQVSIWWEVILTGQLWSLSTGCVPSIAEYLHAQLNVSYMKHNLLHSAVHREQRLLWRSLKCYSVKFSEYEVISSCSWCWKRKLHSSWYWLLTQAMHLLCLL